ncbi:unnamed protein product [Paramecium primaurelia]|uniref:Uncharacterized protein n=1 Tax=Paramecium primaurelia TaxID=5886 RepID=A0A8S1QUK4_PARPR|nr:unnamed protein product [Paramecium primaurelia]
MQQFVVLNIYLDTAKTDQQKFDTCTNIKDNTGLLCGVTFLKKNVSSTPNEVSTCTYNYTINENTDSLKLSQYSKFVTNIFQELHAYSKLVKRSVLYRIVVQSQLPKFIQKPIMFKTIFSSEENVKE